MTLPRGFVSFIRSLEPHQRHDRYVVDLQRYLDPADPDMDMVRTQCVSCDRPTTLPVCAVRKKPWGMCMHCVTEDNSDLSLREMLVTEAEHDPLAPGPAEFFSALKEAGRRLGGRGR